MLLGLKTTINKTSSALRGWISRNFVMSVNGVHYTAWTALRLHCFRVGRAAHNTARSTPTSSRTDPNVIVSMAGRPVFRR